MKIMPKKFYKLTSWPNVIKLLNGDYIAIGITLFKFKMKYANSCENCTKKFYKSTSVLNFIKLFKVITSLSALPQPENTKEGSITVPLTSCLTGLD